MPGRGGSWWRAAGFSCREHPFLFGLNHNVSALPDFKHLLCCVAVVFYSVGSKPISVSIDLKVLSDAFEVRGRLNTNHSRCYQLCPVC